MSSNIETIRDTIRNGSFDQKKEAIDLVISNVANRVTEKFRQKDKKKYVMRALDFLKNNVVINPNDVAIDLIDYLDKVGVPLEQIYQTPHESNTVSITINDPRFWSRDLAVKAIIDKTPLKSDDKKFNQRVDRFIELNA